MTAFRLVVAIRRSVSLIGMSLVMAAVQFCVSAVMVAFCSGVPPKLSGSRWMSRPLATMCWSTAASNVEEQSEKSVVPESVVVLVAGPRAGGVMLLLARSVAHCVCRMDQARAASAVVLAMSDAVLATMEAVDATWVAVSAAWSAPVRLVVELLVSV